jgi:hypothetical protein
MGATTGLPNGGGKFGRIGGRIQDQEQGEKRGLKIEKVVIYGKCKLVVHSGNERLEYMEYPSTSSSR